MNTKSIDNKVREFVSKYGDKAVWQVGETIENFVNEVVREETAGLRKELDRVNNICDRMEREFDRDFGRKW